MMNFFLIAPDCYINLNCVTAIKVQKGYEIGVAPAQRYNAYHVVYTADGQRYILDTDSTKKIEEIYRRLGITEAPVDE